MKKNKLKIGDKVVFCYNNKNYIGYIESFNETKTKIKSKDKVYEANSYLIYRV